MSPTLRTALKTVLGIMLGYAVMVVLILATLNVAWSLLGGGSGAFTGEGPYPSTGWLAFAVVGGFFAACAGGLIARWIGGARAVKILAGLILVLGLAVAALSERAYAGRQPVDKPVAEMTFQEAGRHARQPAWYNWGIPFIGLAGVLLAGRSKEKS